MGVQNLQNFLEAGHVEGGAVPVELLKIARSFPRPNKQNRNKPNTKKLSLILDAECCLDRLYGGFFSGKIKISLSCCSLAIVDKQTIIIFFRLGLWRAMESNVSISFSAINDLSWWKY